MQQLTKVVYAISKVLHSIGVCAIATMMFLTFTSVLLRYVFNRPLTGDYELTEYMMAILVSFGLAYCAAENGNIRVDFVVSRLKPRSMAIVGVVCDFIGLILISAMVWQGFINLKNVYDSNLVSTVMGIAAFPFVAITALGITVLALVLLLNLINRVSKVVNK